MLRRSCGATSTDDPTNRYSSRHSRRRSVSTSSRTRDVRSDHEAPGPCPVPKDPSGRRYVDRLELDRLGRSLRDLVAMLDDLRERGIAFQSLTEATDTTTPTGRAMWQMIDVLAELERSLIAERTRACSRGSEAGREIRTQAQANLREDRARSEDDKAGRKPPIRGGNAGCGSCDALSSTRGLIDAKATTTRLFGKFKNFLYISGFNRACNKASGYAACFHLTFDKALPPGGRAGSRTTHSALTAKTSWLSSPSQGSVQGLLRAAGQSPFVLAERPLKTSRDRR